MAIGHTWIRRVHLISILTIVTYNATRNYWEYVGYFRPHEDIRLSRKKNNKHFITPMRGAKENVLRFEKQKAYL